MSPQYYNTVVICRLLRSKTGLSISKLSESFGVSRSCLYNASSCSSDTSSRRVRVLIAKIIDVKPSVIWASEFSRQQALLHDDLFYNSTLVFRFERYSLVESDSSGHWLWVQF